MSIVGIFLVSECQRMKYSYLQKYCPYFKGEYYYIRTFFFLQYTVLININLYFAGGHLRLIILKWNGINEVAITDAIVRNQCIAKAL